MEDFETVVSYVCDSLPSHSEDEKCDPEEIVTDTLANIYDEIKDKNNREVSISNEF